MTVPTLRALQPAEVGLLENATLGNVNWCGHRFDLADVRERPEFAHYTRLVPDRGDFGIVAQADDAILGVVWALFLGDAGWGFVDDATPEISLWVDAPARRSGVGRNLLRALLAEALHRGLAAVSLSVEADNHAKNLYAAEGFVDVPGREADGVMLRTLRRGHEAESATRALL